MPRRHQTTSATPTGYVLPPLTSRNRISPGGRSGGVRRSRSKKNASHSSLLALLRASPCQGQSYDRRTSRSFIGISEPYFAARRASRYAPCRLQRRHDTDDHPWTAGDSVGVHAPCSCFVRFGVKRRGAKLNVLVSRAGSMATRPRGAAFDPLCTFGKPASATCEAPPDRFAPKRTHATRLRPSRLPVAVLVYPLR